MQSTREAPDEGKYEFRNSKQIRNSNVQMTKTKPKICLKRLNIVDFLYVGHSTIFFKISNFGHSNLSRILYFDIRNFA